MLPRCETILKNVLLVINFILLLAGVVVLTLGLWMRFDYGSKIMIKSGGSTDFFIGVYILVAVGGLMLIVGVLGCCGARYDSEHHDSAFMLGLFFALLIIIFFVETISTSYILFYQAKAIWETQQFYDKIYHEAMSDQPPESREKLMTFHQGLKCCGLNGTVEKALEHTCPETKEQEQQVFLGCPDAIEHLFAKVMPIFAGLCVALSIILVFGISTSIILCCTAKRRRNNSN